MNKMDDKKLLKSAPRDFIYSLMALLIYNGVLQIVIYPFLNSRLGAEGYGTVLYLISTVSVMGMTFGSGASYARMVAKAQRSQTNGDYNIFLMIVALISTVVSAVALIVLHEFTITLYIQLLMIMIVTVMRYYADVQYRMTIRFKEYFLFYVSIAAGNLLGAALYPILHSWTVVIFAGELLAVIFTAATGTVFRKPFFTRSESFSENMKAVWTLSSANLVSALVLNSDRILIRLLVGASQVTVYYTASLIGKIAAMVTTPLNGIIISYLTNYKIRLTKKRFAAVAAVMLALSIIGSALCTVISQVFVKLMYSNVYEAARPYFAVANAGQIFYFISGSLMVVVLNFTDEKYQLWINIAYLILFVLIVIPATLIRGLDGIAYGLLAVNVARFLIVTFVGIVKAKGEIQ